MRRLLVLVVAAASVVALSAGPPVAADPRGGATAAPTQARLPADVHTITLVTGDVVQLTRYDDGRQTAAVDYGRSPSRTGFRMSERDGDLYVIPNEALPYVSSGRLDGALFNLTDLVADGYHDAARTTLPLLIGGARAARGARAVAPPTPAGATRGRELPSIGAVKVTESKAKARQFWEAVTAGAAALSPGVGRIWLDRRVHATLTDSVPQIGAPAAWHAGYDGTGVKVAVLDSGHDPTHPDLAGRVAGAANFTAESGSVDRFGHGTHVAATIAGRGIAGRLGGKGVAPGARLLIGKVLDENGTGDLSGVIAGMEWAVRQGARVVNISLGAQAFEGPDPATEAVDALTASSGALFVISAGNSGPGPQTVGTPGTASSALTVGAVSKQDEIASFSSRGPRLGDGAAKPEITAPGVGIVAARAAGTTLGEVLDRSYTSMSGTSMAAPHVAGAAALVAQKHPNWRAEQIKAALVSSATRLSDAPIWAQGAGRVDVPAALDQQVSADASTISFGKVPAGSAARAATITYRNVGRKATTLTLSVAASDAGASGRSAALSVTPERLTVPAGGTARATVRLDASATAANPYAGMLTARGPRLEVRTPIGFAVTAPMHTLTITAIDRDGVAASGFDSRTELWNLDTGDSYFGFFFGEPATVELPAGRYAMMSSVSSVDADGSPKDATVIGEPELTIDSDRTVHIDARTANELAVDTPDPTTLNRFGLAWQRTTATRSVLVGAMYNPEMVRRMYATPTRPVSVGTFAFFTRWELIAPPLTARVDGIDGAALRDPRLLEGAPPLDGTHAMPLVDGGDGTAEELAAAGAEGAAVLMRYTGLDGVDGQLRAAAAAGARVVFLAPDQPGFFPAFASGATTPAYAITYDDGRRLRQRLAAGPANITLTGIARSPYRYDLLFTEPGAIPADLHYRADDLKLATLDTEFHRYGPQLHAIENGAGFPDGVDVGFSFLHPVTEPQRRTDYVSTQNVAWRTSVVLDAVGPTQGTGTMFGPLRLLRPGDRVREVWFPALIRPAVPQALPNYAFGAPVNRAHDAIRVAIPQYANGDGSQYGWVDGRYDRAELTLRLGDTVIGRATNSSEQFTVPRQRGEYRLTLDVRRDADDQGGRSTSRETSTTWTFHSARPSGDDPVVLPLVQIGYDIETDLTNAVRADRPYPLVLRPGYQPYAAGPGGFDMTVDVSYDDGVHWTAARTRGADTVTATIPPAPAGASFATVRVTARDRHGNRIEQTISRAWRVVR